MGFFANWASAWVINKVDGDVYKGFSAFSYAKKAEMGELRRSAKNVPILYEVSSSDDERVFGVKESKLLDFYARSVFDDVLSDISRVNFYKLWVRAVTLVGVSEGLDLVSLLKILLFYKNNPCCGRVQRRCIGFVDGNVKIAWVNDDADDEDLDAFLEFARPELGVFYCDCKTTKTRVSRQIKRIRKEYGLDGLLMEILFDSDLYKCCVEDFDHSVKDLEILNLNKKELGRVKNIDKLYRMMI